MEEIRLSSWYGKYHIIYRVLYIPAGAVFLPSTVAPEKNGIPKRKEYSKIPIWRGYVRFREGKLLNNDQQQKIVPRYCCYIEHVYANICYLFVDICHMLMSRTKIKFGSEIQPYTILHHCAPLVKTRGGWSKLPTWIGARPILNHDCRWESTSYCTLTCPNMKRHQSSMVQYMLW